MFVYKRPEMVPPGGGWLYIHAETGTKITSSSAENLVIKAKKWHKDNNFPVPVDFAQIIATQVCARCPEFCYSTEPPTAADKAREFAVAASRWIKQRAPVVSEEVFLERKEKCESCELYGGTRTFGFIGCGKCGCTGLKLYLATEKCPLPEPRWKAVS